MRDFSRNLKMVQALAPALRAGSATGGAVDRLGHSALAFAVHAGAWTDGIHTVSADHSDDGSTWEAIPATDLVGTFPVVSSGSTDEATKLVGYIGDRRYVRAKVAVSGSPATGATVGVDVVLSRAQSRPVAA